MRPTYENEYTLARESAIFDSLRTRWKCKIEKLPRKYVVDAICLRGDTPIALLEVKYRTTAFRSYRDYEISLHKIHNGLQLAEFMGISFILVVEFSDLLAAVRPKYCAMRIDGKQGRGDWQDREPMAIITWDKFKVLTRYPKK